MHLYWRGHGWSEVVIILQRSASKKYQFLRGLQRTCRNRNSDHPCVNCVFFRGRRKCLDLIYEYFLRPIGNVDPQTIEECLAYLLGHKSSCTRGEATRRRSQLAFDETLENGLTAKRTVFVRVSRSVHKHFRHMTARIPRVCCAGRKRLPNRANAGKTLVRYFWTAISRADSKDGLFAGPHTVAPPTEGGR